MNAYDLYEFYIEAEDLKGQAHRVKIEKSYVKDVFNPGTKAKEPKIHLRFVGKQKALSLNKTRAGAMIEITGTPEYETWVGVEIVIKPGIQSKKATVIIEAAPPTGPAPRNQPAKIEHATRLAELQAKSETDVITAYSELWKAAGLDNETAQAILKEYTGDFKAAFDRIAKDYAYIIG
jgi:hypothetical protein